MKALVYTGTNEVTYRDEPEPVRKADEALVQIEAVGICGSDMHAYHGHDPRRVPPLILGHEAAGKVVEGAEPGQAVAINPLITCGRCRPCLSGRANLCERRELIGMRYAGAFAELIAVPERNLIPLPAGMSVAHAALMEPCATSWHAIAAVARVVHRPLVEADALIVGGGSIGLLAALILRASGCRSVALAETNPLRRSTAEAAGAMTIDPAVAVIPSAAYDILFDAVGSGKTREVAVQAVRPGGVIAHVGLQDQSGEFDIRTVTLSEITLLGIYTYTPSDLLASLYALHSGALGDLNWTEQRTLAEGAAAFADLDQGRTAAAKIILRP